MNKKTIIHLFDESIITYSTIELFDKLHDFKQQYIVFNHTISSSQQSGNILSINPTNNQGELIDLVNAADIIFVQAFSYEKAKILRKIDLKKKVVIWGLWGYELYNLVNYKLKLNKPELLTEYKEKPKTFLELIKDYYTINFRYIPTIQKVDICFFLLQKDFELFSKITPHRASWHSGMYQSASTIFLSEKHILSSGNNILIGNSSTPSNRHQEIFEALNKLSLAENTEVIVPLNYGDLNYRKNVIKSGEILFKQFRPLIDFIPYDNYLKLLSSCSIVIMGHHRQQSFGTILMSLSIGAKVFLSEKSPLFNWFLSHDIPVFSIENELVQANMQPFPHDKKMEVQQKIRNLTNEDDVIRNLICLFEKASQLSEQKK